MANFGNAASGAMAGASAGSIFGPWGTAGGAALGGLTGLFGSKKKKKKPEKYSTLDPQQQGVYQNYVDSLNNQGPLADLNNFDAQGYNNVFDQTVGRPAYRNFQENVIPSITGQFRSKNLMNSSYAGEGLARAGRDVQENLDAQRSANVFQGQQQAQANKRNSINSVLGMQTFAYNKPEARTPSGIDQILGSIAPQAGEWFADYLRDLRSKKPAAA